MGTVIYPTQFAQTLHAASKKDEFVSVCGARNGQHHVVLIAERSDLTKPLKPGFKWCDACVAKLQKPKRSGS